MAKELFIAFTFRISPIDVVAINNALVDRAAELARSQGAALIRCEMSVDDVARPDPLVKCEDGPVSAE